MSDQPKRCKRIAIALVVALVVLIGSAAISYALIWPKAGGEKVTRDGALRVDTTNSKDGYIVVQAKKANKSYKVRVTYDNESLYYEMPSDGSDAIIPLQFGSGQYKVELFRNVKGNKYSMEGSVKVKADLKDEMAAFLIPHTYVKYDEESEAVKLAAKICEDLDTDKEKLEAVQKYVKNNFIYDYIKATNIQPNTMPDIDGLLEKRMGICQDLAAFVCCALRSQGIPAVFVIGYAGRQYHAWTNVVIDGKAVLYDPTAEITGMKNVKYTAERYY